MSSEATLREALRKLPKMTKHGQTWVPLRDVDDLLSVGGTVGLDGDTSETMLTKFIRLFGSDLTGNPDEIAFIEEVGEVYNYGFEKAHELRACGHSVGDYRDPNYVIGKPETYTASEKCIGCEREAALAAPPATQGVAFAPVDPFLTDQELAQIIREVDGDHSLGAAELAGKILDRLPRTAFDAGGPQLSEAQAKKVLSHCIYDPIDMPLAVKKLNAFLRAQLAASQAAQVAGAVSAGLSKEQLAVRLDGVTRWLEKNQPDVFRRGLWDAVNEVEPVRQSTSIVQPDAQPTAGSDGLEALREALSISIHAMDALASYCRKLPCKKKWPSADAQSAADEQFHMYEQFREQVETALAASRKVTL